MNQTGKAEIVMGELNNLMFGLQEDFSEYGNGINETDIAESIAKLQEKLSLLLLVIINKDPYPNIFVPGDDVKVVKYVERELYGTITRKEDHFYIVKIGNYEYSYPADALEIVNTKAAL